MDEEIGSLLVLLILNTFINNAVLASQCDSAANGLFLFGPHCEYLCHCTGNQKCDDVTGACHKGCDGRWFGPACQYYDVALRVMSRQLDNQPDVHFSGEGNDGNPNTCSYTNFEFAANDRQIPPYWMIFFQKDVNVSKIELQTLPSAIYQGYYEGFKIYIENYPGNKLSYTSNSDRNYIPPAEDRLLCYQHDGSDTPSAEMAVNCGRSLPGNSARIEMRNKSTQLVLCDIKINVGRNFAFGKPASYSFDNEQTSKPGLAVDGATTTHSQCVFVTTSDPWWEVDLGTILQVNRIMISEYNKEYLSGYVVEAAQVPGGNRTTVFTDDSGLAYKTELYASIEARFIRITRPDGNKTLALCEVQVFAECPYLRWGHLCDNKCGHCLDDYCYDWNGYCKNGCESGYKTTDMCLDECEDGRFGKGCFGTCGHCLDGLACNKMTGYCDQGCAPGWTAIPTCKQECQGDTYGRLCLKKCSHKCKGGCNKVDGACNGCVDGWEGKFCDEKDEQSFTTFEIAGLAGGTVGGCLLLLVLVFASVLVYRRYKLALTKRDTTYQTLILGEHTEASTKFRVKTAMNTCIRLSRTDTCQDVFSV